MSSVAESLRTFASIALSVSASALVPAQGTPASPNDLVGTWYAEPVHNGQTGHVGLEIARGENGRLLASVSFLDVQPDPVPFGSVLTRGDRVQIGPLVLTRDAAGDTLRGTLPEELVPKHSITIVFRRAPALEPAAGTEIPTAEPLWRHALGGAVWGGVTFCEGVVFSGCDDGALHALDASTGEARWRFATKGRVRARPTLHEGMLIVPSDDGHLYALDARTGEAHWQAKLGEPRVRAEFGAREFRYDHQAPAATIGDKTVFAASGDGQLFALDVATGEERWHFRAADISTSTPAVYGETVLFASFDGHVYALDAHTGGLRWKHDTGAAVATSPAVCDDLVLVGSRSYDLLALRVADGMPAWNYYYWFSWADSSPTVSERIAYAGSSDGQLVVAVDGETGKERWRFDTGGSPWAQPAVTDDAVFVGAVGVADYMFQHAAAFFAVDRASGRPRWRFLAARHGEEPLWGFASSPTVGDGRVYVGTLDGSVLAFPAAGRDR